jgi:GDP-L-fucose synthase
VRNTHINIGSGEEISIRDLSEMVKKVVGFKGELIFNINKPDGTLRKLVDASKLLDLGWTNPISLSEGLKIFYAWYLSSR